MDALYMQSFLLITQWPNVDYYYVTTKDTTAPTVYTFRYFV